MHPDHTMHITQASDIYSMVTEEPKRALLRKCGKMNEEDKVHDMVELNQKMIDEGRGRNTIQMPLTDQILVKTRMSTCRQHPRPVLARAQGEHD